MRRTTATILRLGTSTDRNRRSCGLHPKAGSPARCSTRDAARGENALLAASLGLSVLGVDVAETAIAVAQQKAHDREIQAEFAVADCFELGRLGRTFDTVMDCGMFHTCDADERAVYAASLASVTQRDATVYVLCFSDEGADVGPHPVGRGDITKAFDPGRGWNVVAVEPDRVLTTFHGDDGAPAWLATMQRI